MQGSLCVVFEHFEDGIHLKQCVTLYLFTLPFTLVSDLQCVTLPPPARAHVYPPSFVESWKMIPIV
jgi:hypothetical protein